MKVDMNADRLTIAPVETILDRLKEDVQLLMRQSWPRTDAIALVVAARSLEAQERLANAVAAIVLALPGPTLPPGLQPPFIPTAGTSTGDPVPSLGSTVSALESGTQQNRSKKR